VSDDRRKTVEKVVDGKIVREVVREGQTVEGQVRDLKALAEKHNLRVPDEFVFALEKEKAHSRYHGDPPEKATVLELASKRRFDVLLIWSIDRWSRRRLDGFQEIFIVLRKHGITVLSHEQPYMNTEGMPTWVQDVVGLMLLSLAEEESHLKSRRVQKHYETKRHRAEGGGGSARWARGRVPTHADVEAIRRLRAEHPQWRNIDIGKEVGLSKETVRRILAGKHPVLHDTPQDS
jgi:DNA invertase Pin-like site-specific DNA recombinase